MMNDALFVSQKFSLLCSGTGTYWYRYCRTWTEKGKEVKVGMDLKRSPV